MRRLLALSSIPLVMAAVSLAPRTASAYERQWHAGASFGYSWLKTDASNHGFGGGLHLTYGLNDMFNLMAEVDTTYQLSSGRLLTLSGSAGASYVIDILEVVPYVGVMAGGYDLAPADGMCGAESQPACHNARLGVSLPFGIDYTVTRSFNIGFAGRYHLLFLGPSSVEQMFTGFVRAELVWGY